jgi:hypothetical protein
VSIEPIGLLTITIGVLCFVLGYRATSVTFIVAALFGSAAAIIIGSANIQPAHLLLAFVAGKALTRRYETDVAIRATRFPQPGFWFMCLVLYGIISAVLTPRLMAGMTEIIPLGTSEYADTGTTVPLGPVSSNFTQTVYLVADFICFIVILAIASTRAGFLTITAALVAYAAGNVLLALLDIVTYTTGTQWLLEFMRNAQYTLHNEEQVTGFKRIVGSFPEASAFANSTIAALGFTGTMWLCRRRSTLTGTLAIASLILLVFSTSSAGLAAAPPVLIIMYATALMHYGFNLHSTPYRSTALLCAPLLVTAATLAVMLDDGASESVRNYLDALIFNKPTSASGIDRANWNAVAIQNFLDSYGLGVGLGTVRTSSFPLALLSNVGIPGAVFYLLFVGSAFLRSRGSPHTFPADVRLAARNACLGVIIGQTFAAPTVEQGLMFYVLAAVACAEPERNSADPWAGWQDRRTA